MAKVPVIKILDTVGSSIMGRLDSNLTLES